jgi:carbon storage regulator
MLVLTRRLGEKLVIAGAIHVRVIAEHGDRVRLGVMAPDGVRVDRLEVHERRTAASPEPHGDQGRVFRERG